MCQKTLAEQALKSSVQFKVKSEEVLALVDPYRQICCLNFDTKIMPILTYAAILRENLDCEFFLNEKKFSSV